MPRIALFNGMAARPEPKFLAYLALFPTGAREVAVSHCRVLLDNGQLLSLSPVVVTEADDLSRAAHSMEQDTIRAGYQHRGCTVKPSRGPDDLSWTKIRDHNCPPRDTTLLVSWEQPEGWQYRVCEVLDRKDWLVTGSDTQAATHFKLLTPPYTAKPTEGPKDEHPQA